MRAEHEGLFSSEELTRIYREAAAAAADEGDRLTVLLAPYARADVPPSRHRSS